MKPHWKADFISHAKVYARMVYLVAEESYSPNKEISALDRLTGYVESLLESDRKELAEKVNELDAYEINRGMESGVSKEDVLSLLKTN